MDPREHPLERLYRSARSAGEVLESARAAGRSSLLEPEGLAVARLVGFGVPEMRVLSGVEAPSADALDLPSADVVVKAISAELVHKSDVGAVVRVRRDAESVADAIQTMATRLDDVAIEGFGVYEHVDHDRDLAGELILGVRRTPDFGAVVSVGAGGLYAEHVAGALAPGRGLALISAHLDAVAVAERLRRLVVVPMLTGELRGQPERLALDRLVDAVLSMHRLAAEEPGLAELELNPVVVRSGELVALDAVARLDEPRISAPPERPIAKLRRLLEPRSIAVVGVSARGRNPGHIIVDNVLAAGFPRDKLVIVKPGVDHLDGCWCVPDLDCLEPVDLLVLAVAADQAAPLLDEVVRRRVAESVILIPGGVGEVAGSEGIAERLRAVLSEARAEGDGPVVCGGNCLGVRSRPGRFDTLFIPRHKLPLGDGGRRGGGGGDLAVISQSGAFAIARASQLDGLDPRYLVTLGNQLDVTVGDVLTYLADDDGTRVVACYVEGFAPLDGDRFLRAAARCRRAGRPVILYRAGRTPAGASKAASHTASMAGDYAVTRELADAAGVVVAETLEDFDDLVTVFTLLPQPAGSRLGALSNAGFECVAIADHLGGLRLADFSEPTRRQLASLLDAERVAGIVGVSNPLDTTPMLGDEAFAAAARTLLDDPSVDVGLVACVPLTGALDTLQAGPASGGEDVDRPASVAGRLADLGGAVAKPWVAVVDSGPLYDAMARRLRRAGVPTFRRVDRAARALDTFCRWHADLSAPRGRPT